MTDQEVRREVPVTTYAGLLLRPWRDDDARAVLELAQDPQCRAWSWHLRRVHDVADALAWIDVRRGPDRLDWAVCDPATGEHLGRVSLHHFDPLCRSAEVGYAVWPRHRGEGVATRAVAAALEHGFGRLDLARVELLHAVGNTASCAVATRAGFAFEGREREALDHGDGVRHDTHRHARLVSDPPGPAVPAPTPLETPVLEGDGLRLRPWSEDDAEGYLRGLRDPAVARWSPRSAPATADEGRRRFARSRARALAGESVGWAVEAAGVLAGSVALRGVNQVDRAATASYWVLPEARCRGVATGALLLATAHAGRGLGLHRVQLQHAVANTASCRVAEKAGFALEGIQRESCLLPDGFVDEHLHARVAVDR